MSITINDGETTPVAHVFDRAREGVDSVEYLNTASGIPVAYERLAFNLKRPTGQAPNPGRFYTARLRLEMPVLEAVPSGATNVQGYAPADARAYLNTMEVILRVHQRSSEQERTNLRAMIGNAILTDVQVAAYLDKLVSVPTG